MIEKFEGYILISTTSWHSQRVSRFKIESVHHL